MLFHRPFRLSAGKPASSLLFRLSARKLVPSLLSRRSAEEALSLLPFRLSAGERMSSLLSRRSAGKPVISLPHQHFAVPVWLRIQPDRLLADTCCFPLRYCKHWAGRSSLPEKHHIPGSARPHPRPKDRHCSGLSHPIPFRRRFAHCNSVLNTMFPPWTGLQKPSQERIPSGEKTVCATLQYPSFFKNSQHAARAYPFCLLTRLERGEIAPCGQTSMHR